MMPGMNSLWYRFPDCFLLKVHWIVSWGCCGLCCYEKGQEDGEWLQTEQTPVTEPKAKYESSAPIQVGLTRAKVITRTNFRWMTPGRYVREQRRC